MTLDEFQKEVGEWGIETFPESDFGSILDHFSEEALELVGVDRMQAAIKKFKATRKKRKSGDMLEEAADCLLLLLHFCHRCHASLMSKAQGKMDTNRQRHWGPSASGYWKHEDDPC